MQLKLLVLLLYLLSKTQNETVAEGDNKKVVTKYIYHMPGYGNALTFEKNNFDENISELGEVFYK